MEASTATTQRRPRVSRAERKQRTRAELIAAAATVFLREGFHQASLDAIAEEAGYTKGAVYSNFESKDELFLAVLAGRYTERIGNYAEAALDQPRLEDSYRAVARFMFEQDRRDPRWAPLLLEFWAHASRREDLRRAAVETRERFIEAIAGLVERLVERHGARLRLPAKEVARASGGFMRGVGIEWMLEPSTASLEEFEQAHCALMMGLTETS